VKKRGEMGLHASGTSDPKEVRNWRIHLLGFSPPKLFARGRGSKEDPADGGW